MMMYYTYITFKTPHGLIHATFLYEETETMHGAPKQQPEKEKEKKKKGDFNFISLSLSFSLNF